MRRSGAPLLFAGTVLLVAVDIGVAATFGLDSPTQYVTEASNAMAWALGGLIAARLRPGNRIGTLMLRLGFILALNITAGDHLANRSWPLIILVTVASTATPVQWAAAIHVALAFPSGLVRDRMSARVVRVAYVWSLFGPVAFRIGRSDNGCPMCAAPAGLGLLPTSLDRILLQVDTTLAGGLIVVAALVLGRRFLTASARQRRVLAYPCLGLLLAAAFAVTVLASDVHSPGSRPFHPAVFLGLAIASVAAVPIGFLVGLLRERLDQARVSDLVARLAATPVMTLGPSLSEALGDPSARLVFAVQGGYVDQDGRTVHGGPDSRLTAVGDPGAPGVFLLHDRSLDAQPELLASVSAAVGLALDNARLRAEILAQLAEVRASRERLVEAGDNARRRLERNLHDGAQQSLIALGLSLRLIRQRIATVDPDTLTLLEETETQTRAAIGELRDLARGIHPAILSEQGLAPALEQLANRCSIPVRLEVDCPRTLPPATEVTAYYVVSEALANVAKHAAASTAWVRVTTSPDGIGVHIGDDGVGGAHSYPGSGLVGLADRVAAVGGTLTLDSDPGRGTRVDVHIPIIEPA
jgi:signal transduction histidine kinase